MSLLRIVLFSIISLGISYGMDIPSVISQEDQKLISEYYKNYTEVYSNGNKQIHSINHDLNWKGKLPELLRIDDTYFQSKADWGVDQVGGFIRASSCFVEGIPEYQACINQNLAQLETHCRANSVESAETGANVPQLFSRCWSLANFEELREPGNSLATKDEGIYILVNYLCQNSQESGGCYAGHAGRLALFYLQALKSAMDFKNELGKI